MLSSTLPQLLAAVEQGVQHNIQQGGQHAKDQVGDDLPVLL